MRSTFWLKIIWNCCIAFSLLTALKAQQAPQLVQKLSAMEMLAIYEPQTTDSLIYFQGKKYLVLLNEYFKAGKLYKVSVYKGMDYVDWTEPHILSSKLFHKAYNLSDTLGLHFRSDKKLRINNHTYLLRAREFENNIMGTSKCLRQRGKIDGLVLNEVLISFLN